MSLYSQIQDNKMTKETINEFRAKAQNLSARQPEVIGEVKAAKNLLKHGNVILQMKY